MSNHICVLPTQVKLGFRGKDEKFRQAIIVRGFSQPQTGFGQQHNYNGPQSLGQNDQQNQGYSGPYGSARRPGDDPARQSNGRPFG